MDLDDLFLVFRRRWRAAAMGALAAFLCLALVVPSIPVRYRSECKVLSLEATPAWPTSLLGSRELGDRVAERLRLLGDPSPPDGASIVTGLEVKEIEGTGYFCLAISDGDPSRSPLLLNLLVEEAARLLAERTLSGEAPRPLLVPVQLASVAQRRGLSLLESYAVAAGFSLLIGGALALAREALDGRIHTAHDLSRSLGLCTLAEIPRAGAGGAALGREPAARGLRRGSVGADGFDSAARILHRRCGGTRAVLLASAEGVPGVASVATGLAGALERRGLRAAVVGDGGSCELAAASHDIVLIDSGPLCPSGGALGLAPMVDGVILVARAGSTRSSALEKTRRALADAGGDILGAIIDGADPSRTAGHPRGGSARRVRRPSAARVGTMGPEAGFSRWEVRDGHRS